MTPEDGVEVEVGLFLRVGWVSEGVCGGVGGGRGTRGGTVNLFCRGPIHSGSTDVRAYTGIQHSRLAIASILSWCRNVRRPTTEITVVYL